MKKRVLFLLLLTLILTGTGIAAESQLDWVHTQEYEGWGMALVYGEDVTVEYTAETTWNRRDNGEVLFYNLERLGTAKIYDSNGVLIEKLPFWNSENFTDVGGDASFEQEGGWFLPDYYSEDMERLEYVWRVGEVFYFRGTAEDGFWNCSYSVTGVGTFECP